MDDINYTKYSNKKPYNNLPVAEGLFLAPFLVRDWNEVKQMDYHRDNIETWHFSGIGVLVAFTPVTKEQFPVTMKLLPTKPYQSYTYPPDLNFPSFHEVAFYQESSPAQEAQSNPWQDRNREH